MKMPRQGSTLESLPAELLEGIFLASYNGNLLLASPRIAAKLSNNEVLYKMTFVIAFYPPKVLEVLDLLGLSHRYPAFCRQNVRTDHRSMAKAVLSSRWCTCGWVMLFLGTLGDCYDIWLLFALRSAEFYYNGSQRMETGNWKHRLSALARRFSFINRAHDRGMEDLRLGEYSLATYGAQLSPEDWDLWTLLDSKLKAEPMLSDYHGKLKVAFKLIGYGFAWSFFGIIPLEWYYQTSCLYSKHGYTPHQPFRRLVYDTLRNMKPFSKQFSSYAALEDAPRLSRNETRFFTVIDWWLYPADAPLKVSPSFHRLAAIKATASFRPDKTHGNMWEAFMYLADVDPTSVPRTDVYIQEYALYRYQNIKEMADTEDHNPVKHGEVWTLTLDSMMLRDIKFLNYMMTGKVNLEKEQDSLSIARSTKGLEIQVIDSCPECIQYVITTHGSNVDPPNCPPLRISQCRLAENKVVRACAALAETQWHKSFNRARSSHHWYLPPRERPIIAPQGSVLFFAQSIEAALKVQYSEVDRRCLDATRHPQTPGTPGTLATPDTPDTPGTPEAQPQSRAFKDTVWPSRGGPLPEWFSIPSQNILCSMN